MRRSKSIREYNSSNYLTPDDIKEVVDLIKRQNSLRNFKLSVIFPILKPQNFIKKFCRLLASCSCFKKKDGANSQENCTDCKSPLLGVDNPFDSYKSDSFHQHSHRHKLQRQETVKIGSKEDPFQ